MNGDLLRLEGVSATYGQEPVLVDISLAVRGGSFLGLVGPSGSGKTSVLKLITGALRPSAGRIARTSGAVRIGYVPQVETVNWFFPVTVLETVLMGRTGRRVPWPSREELREARKVLDELGLGAVAGRHIRELSGGQQQRVFIARALLGHPRLLLLDEPTSGVDVHTRHDILHLLHELHHDGLAIVVTTHDLNGVAAHLPEIVCLNREVVAVGPPRRVLTPEVLERTYGAPMEVLHHGGMPVVVDHPEDVEVLHGEEHHHEHPA